jgi:hypothetical protein
MRDISDSPVLPDWAVAQARASLKIGLAVPEIEQRLVAKGLSPATATAVVTSILEERVRERAAPSRRAEQWQPVHRILSMVVGVACLLLAYWFGGGVSAAEMLLVVLPALACIWFPEVIARSAAPGRAAIARGVGWLLLLLLGGYRLFMLLI